MRITGTKTIRYEATTNSLDDAVAFIRGHEGEMAVTNVSITSEWQSTRTFGDHADHRVITGFYAVIEGEVPMSAQPE